jgi:hypothetical protein
VTIIRATTIIKVIINGSLNIAYLQKESATAARSPTGRRETAAVHAALLIAARPGLYPGKKEKPLCFDRIHINTTAKRTQRLSAFAFAAGIIFIFSAWHIPPCEFN